MTTRKTGNNPEPDRERCQPRLSARGGWIVAPGGAHRGGILVRVRGGDAEQAARDVARALILAAALSTMRETIADTIEDYAHMCDEDDPDSDGAKLLRRLRSTLAALDAAGGAA